MIKTLRSVGKVIYAKERAEGLGATVRRSIGVIGMHNFTPFIMLDHFRVSPTAGFPDHPHRGQETVTLVMKNYMLHEDFTGQSGILRPGDLQFMTAGKGIMHSEMPYSEDGSDVEGIQLWVDLPKDLKHCEPRYRDLKKEEIPVVKPNADVEVKVISGKSYGVESIKELAYTPMDYYWFTVQKGGVFEQEMPKDYNTCLYILKGKLEIETPDGVETIEEFNNVFFQQDGDEIRGKSVGDEPAEFVLLAGKALDQPIVQYGPFVETSKTGIHNALYDFQTTSNGFERANGWRSEISSGVNDEMFAQKNSQDQ